MDDIIKKINAIFSTLQLKDWAEHDAGLLSQAQGKLASYIANVNAYCADAQYEYEARELNAQGYESERFLHHRGEKKTLEEAKHLARLDALVKHTETLNAKRQWLNLRGIADAIKGLSVACSTTLKHYESERINAKYQGN